MDHLKIINRAYSSESNNPAFWVRAVSHIYEDRPNATQLQHTLVNRAYYEDHLNAPAVVPVNASCGSADL